MPGLHLVALLGCTEFNLDPIDSGPATDRQIAVTETFVQAALPKVDLLLVLDRTASMSQEHAALIEASAVLEGALEGAGIAWQLGVIGADMQIDTAGWLLGSPWVLTPTDGHPSEHIAAALAAQDGTPADEAGIAAALAALDLSAPGLPNAGFRRHDAALHVIFASDANDSSDVWLAGDPVQTFVDRLAAEGSAMPATASAVVGDVPGGCSSVNGSAQPGTRYVEIAEATGGQVVSICATDFDPIAQALGEASIVLQDRFVLRDVPASSQLAVTLDGDPVVSGWTYDPAGPAIVFDPPPPAAAVIEVAYTVVVRVPG